ncbi:MAG: penicillin-binding protein 2 [bacterium]
MTFDDEFGLPDRRRALNTGAWLIFAVLMLQLFRLQWIYHGQFTKESEENSVRVIVKEPIRGHIYDRAGKLFVDVGPSYSVMIVPAEFSSQNFNRLSTILQLEPRVLEERITRAKKFSPYLGSRIKRDVDIKTLSALEENLPLLNGVSYQVESKRVYPLPVRAAHLLGYSREISESQLALVSDYYALGDIIGTSGLEAQYEFHLRGEKGFEYVAVNAKGQVLGTFDLKQKVDAREGNDLYLALDVDVQSFAESLMVANKYMGAIVAIDPSNGGIITMVGKPDFDPSLMSGVIPAEVWAGLNSDPDKPLFNRAALTRYPPGSTFKMVLAAAALEEGIIDENYRIQCGGSFRYGNNTFKDLHVHGSTNMYEAIERSCNVFFYQLVLKVGFNKWTEYGRRFGFGKPTGTDTGEETAGLLPSASYYDTRYGKGRWTQGYIISLAIGQGEVGVSPLQMAQYAAALANGGMLYQPHAVNFVFNKTKRTMEPVLYRTSNVGLSPRVMGIIREGMRRVVHGPGATAHLAAVPGVISAGKTGTAENPHGNDHAWYIGFAPFENPKIAVVILLENSGFGGAKAAPLAKMVIQRYLTNLNILPAAPQLQKKPKAVTQAELLPQREKQKSE